MIITHEQTIIIPATLEGYEYAEDVCKKFKGNNIGHKREDSTTGICIKWTTSFMVGKESDTDG